MKQTGKWTTRVPIYASNLTLVVGSDSASIIEQRELMNDILGDDGRPDGNPGFLSYNHNEFAIFISLADYTPGLVAHEVFHCACRIMELIGHDLDRLHHEPHAYLIEWLTDWVYKQPWRQS